VGLQGVDGEASAHPSGRAGFHAQGLETGTVEPRTVRKPQAKSSLAVEKLPLHFQVLLIHPGSARCFSASPVPKEIW